MAGSYPNVPGRRMAWDVDGTIGLYRNTTENDPWTEMSSAQLAALNNESAADSTVTILGANDAGHVCLIFPELRDLDGVFHRANTTGRIGILEVSVDTTNGIDGTWTTAIADYSDPNIDVTPEYRDAITSITENGKRALRFATLNTGSAYTGRALHVYGEITSGQTPDKLLYFDETTTLEFVLPVDYGDAPRGSAEDFEFRLHNDSGSLTANTITVTAEDLTGGSSAWLTFDEAGGGFSSSEVITSIGAGANSALLTCRVIRPDSAALGVHAARIKAVVTSWT